MSFLDMILKNYTTCRCPMSFLISSYLNIRTPTISTNLPELKVLTDSQRNTLVADLAFSIIALGAGGLILLKLSGTPHGFTSAFGTIGSKCALSLVGTGGAIILLDHCLLTYINYKASSTPSLVTPISLKDTRTSFQSPIPTSSLVEVIDPSSSTPSTHPEDTSVQPSPNIPPPPSLSPTLNTNSVPPEAPPPPQPPSPSTYNTSPPKFIVVKHHDSQKTEPKPAEPQDFIADLAQEAIEIAQKFQKSPRDWDTFKPSPMTEESSIEVPAEKQKQPSKFPDPLKTSYTDHTTQIKKVDELIIQQVALPQLNLAYENNLIEALALFGTRNLNLLALKAFKDEYLKGKFSLLEQDKAYEHTTFNWKEWQATQNKDWTSKERANNWKSTHTNSEQSYKVLMESDLDVEDIDNELNLYFDTLSHWFKAGKTKEEIFRRLQLAQEKIQEILNNAELRAKKIKN